MATPTNDAETTMHEMIDTLLFERDQVFLDNNQYEAACASNLPSMAPTSNYLTSPHPVEAAIDNPITSRQWPTQPQPVTTYKRCGNHNKQPRPTAADYQLVIREYKKSANIT